MSISETAEIFGKDANYDLITPNGIIRHFIVFIEAEEVRDYNWNHTGRMVNFRFLACLNHDES